MADWTTTHDIAYSFLCIAFMADGSIADSELEAIRGNVRVLLPEMPGDEFDEKMNHAVQRFVALGEEQPRTEQFDSSLANLKTLFTDAEQRYNFIKNLAYIVRADEAVHDKEMMLVEHAVEHLGMKDEVTLTRKEKTLFVDKKS